MKKQAVYEYILKGSISPVKCIWQVQYSYTGNLAYHKEYEIHFIKKGKGYYFIKNKKYPFTHNNLIVIRSEEIHRFIPSKPPITIEKGSIYFPSSFIKNSKIKEIIESSPHIIKLGEREATLIEIIFRSITEEIERKETDWGDVIYYQTMVFISLLKRCSLKRSPTIRKNPRIGKIITFIEETFTKDITLSDIAKASFISPSHLSHLFKRETGLSIKQYIIQRRIMEAKNMLLEDYEEKVSVIAQKVGFSDFQLFNRAFKKITGLTPVGYRKISGRT
ncbi:MAG: AraC family transcriptional regulator [Candidatus Omnitrophica bacterium]|nr:AraC family transcriptional regulator [Candidatus Omnitrophota bacterium]MCM8777627.1 AraC family transcriptional regulator [Candidatus Omnitrophota bacterium]